MKTDTSSRTERQLTVSPAPLGQPQLELALAAASAAQLLGRPSRPQSRAQWWFERMRQVVEQACDWQPRLTPRPEQTWFANTWRTPSLAPRVNGQEHQICE
jgi:hypothetical protein